MKLIVGISGASGVIYGIRFLEALNRKNIETHLVLRNSFSTYAYCRKGSRTRN